jgi:hypothetical protein
MVGKLEKYNYVCCEQNIRTHCLIQVLERDNTKYGAFQQIERQSGTPTPIATGR